MLYDDCQIVPWTNRLTKNTLYSAALKFPKKSKRWVHLNAENGIATRVTLFSEKQEAIEFLLSSVANLAKRGMWAGADEPKVKVHAAHDNTALETDASVLRWWCQQLLDIIENYDIRHDACEEEIALLNDIRAAVDPASSQKCSGTQTGVAT